MSLFLTFNKYTTSDVCIRTFEKKQTKNKRRKENHRKKNKSFYWKVWNVLGKILYFIRKYFIKKNTVVFAPIIVLK